MYWITLSPEIGAVLIRDSAEEQRVRTAYAENVRVQQLLAAQVKEDNRVAAENDILAQAAVISADRKKK